MKLNHKEITIQQYISEAIENDVVHALTSGEYSMGWKLEKIDSSEANGLDCFKVVKERAE